MMKEAPESRIKELYISETFLQKYPDLPEHLKKKAEMVSDPVFAHMSDTKTPQGILGVIRRMSWTMDELLHGEDGKAPFLMVLDHLQDPGNLGTIFRTAEGAGGDRSDPWFELRGSLSAQSHPVHDGIDLSDESSLCR